MIWKFVLGCFLASITALSAQAPRNCVREQGRLLRHFHAESPTCANPSPESAEEEHFCACEEPNLSPCKTQCRTCFGRNRYFRCGPRRHPQDCCCCKCAPIYDDSDKDDLLPDQNAYWPTKKTDSWMRELKW